MPSQQQQGQPQPQPQVVGSTRCGRWCPTPEQLMILQEMYRGGLRTPNASQIQQITAHLACYGRIEGKNVFYWFQNHKARDRQKLRRRLCMSHHLLSCAQYYAAAAHHAHGHHHAFVPAASYGGCGGGVFDQAAAGQLLSPTSPATPSAAAAYGYYTPAFAAAAPASRSAGNATPPSPTTQLFRYQGGGLLPAEVLGRPESYSYTLSLEKLVDNFGVALDDVVVSSAAAVDMAPPGRFDVAPPPAAFCRPLKTLDLFPGGLKEEQHDVA